VQVGAKHLWRRSKVGATWFGWKEVGAMHLGAELVNQFLSSFFDAESNLLGADLHNFSSILIGYELWGQIPK
jgi:hypothetical protein